MKRVKSFIIFIIFMVVAGHFVKLVIDAGLFMDLKKGLPMNCELEKGLQGAEDLELVGSYLFISSNWHPPAYEDPNRSGGIYFKNLNSKDPVTKPLEVNLPRSFKPHGIEVYQVNESTIRLWVINHSNKGDFIEVFDFKDEILIHRESLSDPLLYNANDIGAVDQNRFFVSIDHGFRSHMGKLFEDISRFGRGYIMAYDGDKFRKINGHYSFPNGIEVVGDQLLVALMLERSILSATIEVNGMNLLDLKKNFIGFGPDNITWDSGREKLYAGTHPKVLDLLVHSKKPKRHSPSQVLEIDPKNNYSTSVLYANNGSPLSAISVGLFSGNDFYMGSIFQDGILKCSMDEISNEGEE